MKEIIKKYLFLFIIAGSVIAVDQITKAVVRANLDIREIWMPWDWLLPYARILYIDNTGVAFGMFKGLGDVFKILIIIVSGAIIYFFPRVPREDWTLRVALGLQLGGALGNLIDRFTLGYVTDFISLGTFPIFNVADSSITIGVIILIFGVWIQELEERRQLKASAELQNQADLSEQEEDQRLDAEAAG